MFTDTNKIFSGQRNYYNLDFENHKYLKQINKKVETLINDMNMEDYYFSEVFNVAYGGNTNLIELFNSLKNNLAKFDKDISNIEPIFGEYRVGDVPHSQASILKAKTILGYSPEFNSAKGFELAAEWYFNNLS